MKKRTAKQTVRVPKMLLSEFVRRATHQNKLHQPVCLCLLGPRFRYYGIAYGAPGGDA